MATASETKTCTKCGTERSLDEFRQRKRKSGNGLYHLGVCRVCECEQSEKYRLENSEKCKKALADWKKNNPDVNAKHTRKSYAKRRLKCRETNLRWIAANRGRYLEWSSNYRKRIAEALTDGYVAGAIRMPVAQAPAQLIALKRDQLTLHRATKQLKEEMKNVE